MRCLHHFVLPTALLIGLGAGWTPPNKIKSTGSRTGEGDAAVVKVEALDWGGSKHAGEIRNGAIVVLSDSGSAARLPNFPRPTAAVPRWARSRLRARS